MYIKLRMHVNKDVDLLYVIYFSLSFFQIWETRHYTIIRHATDILRHTWFCLFCTYMRLTVNTCRIDFWYFFFKDFLCLIGRQTTVSVHLLHWPLYSQPYYWSTLEWHLTWVSRDVHEDLDGIMVTVIKTTVKISYPSMLTSWRYQLRNKTSVSVFYRNNKIWVQVWVRMNALRIIIRIFIHIYHKEQNNRTEVSTKCKGIYSEKQNKWVISVYNFF